MFPWILVKTSAAAILYVLHIRPLVTTCNPNRSLLEDATPPNNLNLRLLDVSRGGSDEDSELPTESHNSIKNAEGILEGEFNRNAAKKTRYADDFIEDFIFDPDISGESRTLREMIVSRTNSYLEDLVLSGQYDQDPPHPKKLLHYLAPRVPAIKHSPDFMLRIHAARTDLDAGVAASLIGTMGRVSEIYDRNKMLRRSSVSEVYEILPSIGAEIVSDRRFEQLVECVLCGIDVKRQKHNVKASGKDTTDSESAGGDEIEVNSESDILDIASSSGIKVGLSIRDACRAAWGIASLGGGQLETMGGEKINDILISLSWRAAELLLARAKKIRSNDMAADEFNREAEEIVHDVASAMFVFGKVKALTGLKSEHLFNICCSILSQSQELSLWKKKEEDILNNIADSNFEFEEVVERLAAAEGDIDIEGNLVVEKLAKSEKELELSSVLDNESQAAATANVSSIIVQQDTAISSDLLLDSLSPNEVANIMFSLALHSNSGVPDAKEEISLPETTAALGEVAFDRLLEWLRHDLEVARSTSIRKQCEQEKAAFDDETNSFLDSAPKESNAKVPKEHINEDALEIPSVETTISDSVPNDDVATATSKIQISPQVEEVQVVDAATLLAMSNDAADGAQLQVETETIITSANPLIHPPKESSNILSPTDGSPPEVKEVQVVDAATLLAMSDDVTDGEPLEMETETIITSNESTVYHLDDKSSTAFQTGIDAKVPTSDGPPSTKEICRDELPGDEILSANNLQENRQNGQLFSLHELCTIAWSASQLKDPLRFEVIDTITNIIAVSDREEMIGLLGIEKLNLISAMAQRTLERRPHGQVGDFESNPALFVSRMVAENALVELGLFRSDIGENDIASKINDVLTIYQPHELSSLVWSLSCVTLNNINISNRDERGFGAVSTLATLAVLTAKSNVAIFSSEDLAKITWSFLIQSDNYPISSRTLVYKSLGHLLTAIETSLLRWESGHFTNHTVEEKRPNRRNRFVTFFQKRWMHAGEDRIGDFHDDDDTNLSSPQESGKLPLLRDLPIDPSTLCRLASSCFRAAEDQHIADGSWTLLRVAVRLLTSKHGYLLKETSIQGMIGLCKACASNKEVGKGRDYISRILARRIVQLLNEALQETKAESASGLHMLSEATPAELCSLFWSLGEIGVRHSSIDESPLFAFKRMRLVTDKPLLSRDELESLSPASFATLLNALVAMGTTSTDRPFVESVLCQLESKIDQLSSGSEFCQVVDSLSLIRRLVGNISKEKRKNNGDKPNTDIQDKHLTPENGNDSIEKKNATKEEMHDLCTRLLSLSSEAAAKKVPEFTAKEIRALMTTYAVLPLQAETMVDAIDNELTKRVSALERAGSMKDSASIAKLVRKAADDAVEAANAFGALSEGAAPPTDKDDEHSVAHEIESLSELLDRAAAAASAAAARLERVVQGTKVTTDECLRRLEEGEAIELGRCQELVSDYRRIEFSK